MERKRERELLLKRFLTPRQVCKVARSSNVVNKCEKEIGSETLQDMIVKLAEKLKEEELKDVIEDRGGKRLRKRFFRGHHYTVLGGEVKAENGTEGLTKDLRSALRKHKWKAFYPLRCALELDEFTYDEMVRCLAQNNVDYMPNQMLFLFTNKYRLLLSIKKKSKKFWKVPEETRDTLERVVDRVKGRIEWYKKIRKS